MALRVSVFSLFVYYYVDVVAIMYRKQYLPGGVNKQQEAIGSIMKHQEVSESFRRCQEAPGKYRKHQKGTPSK